MEINGIEVCNTKPEDLAALCQGVEGSTCIATFRRPPQKYPYQVGYSKYSGLNPCLP